MRYFTTLFLAGGFLLGTPSAQASPYCVAVSPGVNECTIIAVGHAQWAGRATAFEVRVYAPSGSLKATVSSSNMSLQPDIGSVPASAGDRVVLSVLGAGAISLSS